MNSQIHPMAIMTQKSDIILIKDMLGTFINSELVEEMEEAREKGPPIPQRKTRSSHLGCNRMDDWKLTAMNVIQMRNLDGSHINELLDARNGYLDGNIEPFEHMEMY